LNKLRFNKIELRKGIEPVFKTPEEWFEWQKAEQLKSEEQVFNKNRQDSLDYLMRESDVNTKNARIDSFIVSDSSSMALMERFKAFTLCIQQNTQPLNLVLSGAYGAGKTFTACCVLSAAREMGKTVLAKKWSSVIDLLWYQDNQKSQRNNFKRLITGVDVLLIDEVGAAEHKLTDAQQSELGKLLRVRANKSKYTIITTNLISDELKAAISTYAAEGLKDGGVNYLLIPMNQKYNKRNIETVYAVDGGKVAASGGGVCTSDNLFNR